jgi:hypothetical protein
MKKDETGDYFVEQDKPRSERQIVCVFTYMWESRPKKNML